MEGNSSKMERDMDFSAFLGDDQKNYANNDGPFLGFEQQNYPASEPKPKLINNDVIEISDDDSNDDEVCFISSSLPEKVPQMPRITAQILPNPRRYRLRASPLHVTDDEDEIISISSGSSSPEINRNFEVAGIDYENLDWGQIQFPERARKRAFSQSGSPAVEDEFARQVKELFFFYGSRKALQKVFNEQFHYTASHPNEKFRIGVKKLMKMHSSIFTQQGDSISISSDDEKSSSSQKSCDGNKKKGRCGHPSDDEDTSSAEEAEEIARLEKELGLSSLYQSLKKKSRPSVAGVLGKNLIIDDLKTKGDSPPPIISPGRILKKRFNIQDLYKDNTNAGLLDFEPE